jgi:hypothetical protein
MLAKAKHTPRSLRKSDKGGTGSEQKHAKKILNFLI